VPGPFPLRVRAWVTLDQLITRRNSADHLSEGDRAARCRTRKKRPASAGNRPPVGPASKSAPKGRAQSRRGIPIRLSAGAFPVEGAPNSRRPVWRIPEGAAERA
jgi:hypothetical protein